MRVLIMLVSLAALGCALAILAAGPGSQMGWWDWRTGLNLIRQVSNPIEIIEGKFSLSPILTLGALSALGGLVLLFIRPRGLGVFALIAALAAGGMVQIPLKMKAAYEANPPIHDITTDFDNPPQIVAGASADRINPPDYRGSDLVPGTDKTIADAQREAFPDIKSRRINAGLDESAEIVREVIDDMNMELLSATFVDDKWRIEATYKSRWFGFIDDFVVRLTPEGSMTRVDVRSKSRVGGSDLGANAARVRAFYEKLEAATS